MKLWPNGIGGLTGEPLATTKPLYLSGDVWFVNSTGGVDGASPAGKDRQKPLATLAQAQTNSANGDIIVLLDGHTETFTAALAITKNLAIVGEGSTAGVPTAKLIMNAAAQCTLVLSALGTILANIKFPAGLQSNTGSAANQGKVHMTGSSAQIRGCYFEESALDQLPAITIASGAANCRLETTTIISTATTVATRPTYGVYGGGTATDLDVVGLILSDGTVGFSGSAWDTTTGAITRLRGQGVSLLLGADMKLHASTTGWISPSTVTGGGGISW